MPGSRMRRAEPTPSRDLRGPAAALLLGLLGCAGLPRELPAALRAQDESVAGPEATPRRRVHRVRLLLGVRDFDAGASSVSKPPMAGVEYVRESLETGMGFTLGFQSSKDEGTDAGLPTELTSTEFYAGFRQTLTHGSRLRPYVGAGLTFIDTDLTSAGAPVDNDTTPGLYGHGGLVYDVAPFVFLGFDLRATTGSAHYIQAAAVLGFTF